MELSLIKYGSTLLFSGVAIFTVMYLWIKKDLNTQNGLKILLLSSIATSLAKIEMYLSFLSWD